jgi:hypothetical protein
MVSLRRKRGRWGNYSGEWDPFFLQWWARPGELLLVDECGRGIGFVFVRYFAPCSSTNDAEI